MVVPEVGQAAEMESRRRRRQLATASRVRRRRWWAKESETAVGKAGGRARRGRGSRGLAVAVGGRWRRRWAKEEDGRQHRLRTRRRSCGSRAGK